MKKDKSHSDPVKIIETNSLGQSMSRTHPISRDGVSCEWEVETQSTENYLYDKRLVQVWPGQNKENCYRVHKKRRLTQNPIRVVETTTTNKIM